MKTLDPVRRVAGDADPLPADTSVRARSSARPWLLLFALLLGAKALAAPPAVYIKTVDMPLDLAYTRVHAALEDNRFWVVFEADMGARMARFKERWGEDYNRSKLDAVKSVVFCHIWWTNQIANADPDMLAMCPLHLSLYEREGKTSVLMLRPSVLARGSNAETTAADLEVELVKLIEDALR